MTVAADLIASLVASAPNGSAAKQTQKPSEITAFSQLLMAATKGKAVPAVHAAILGPTVGPGIGGQMALAANAINELIAPQPAAAIQQTVPSDDGASGDPEFNQLIETAVQTGAPNAAPQDDASPNPAAPASQRGGRKALTTSGADAADVLAGATGHIAPLVPPALPNVTAMAAATKQHQKSNDGPAAAAAENGAVKAPIAKAPLTTPAASSAATPIVALPAIAATEQLAAQPAPASELAAQGALQQSGASVSAPGTAAAAGALPLVSLQLTLRVPPSPGAATLDASAQFEDIAGAERLSDIVQDQRQLSNPGANAAAFKSALKAAASPAEKTSARAAPGAPGAERTEPFQSSHLSPAQAATLTQVGAYAERAMAAAHMGDAPSPGAQVAHEIVRRFAGGATHFEMRLDPPELGRVDVRLEVSRDHKVTAIVAADNPQALAELAKHARDLEQSLLAAGLMIGDEGLSFDLRQGSEGAAGRPQREGGALDGTDDDGDAGDSTTAARPIGFERWRGVRVDIWI